jgi:glycosyltransferase involved in cell wall biosynthesis
MIVTFRLSSLGTGGAERVFLSVASALVRTHGADVHFVVDRLGGGELERLVSAAGCSLFGLDCSRTAVSILPMKRYIDRYRPDVVISAYTDTNMAMLLSAKISRHQCLLIVSEHASLDEHWQYATTKRKTLLNAYVRFGYRLADHVLAVSEGIVGQIKRRMKSADNVSCIYNPVRFGESRLRAPHVEHQAAHTSGFSGKTIVAVGRIARQKDYLNLLQAFKEVTMSRDTRLVIVGEFFESATKAILDEYIVRNDLGSRVDFVGFTDEVEQYYRGADLFVLSSAWEGFGNVLVEALAFGLPIVSTDCNHGPAEILCDGKFGTLVPVGDHAALAAAMCASLDAPAPDRDALRARSQDFSESRIGAQYWDLIQELRAR